jgi:hypothetical protein
MKKQSKRQPHKKTTAAPASVPAAKTDRRSLLRNGAIVALGLGGGGFFAVNMVMATISEQDLTRVGQGIPTIVQVHDPQCPSCQELQRETRAALKSFDDSALTYLVANIKSTDGLVFANTYGAAHITLLLFDASGQLRGTLAGVRPRDELQQAFARLVASPT